MYTVRLSVQKAICGTRTETVTRRTLHDHKLKQIPLPTSNMKADLLLYKSCVLAIWENHVWVVFAVILFLLFLLAYLFLFEWFPDKPTDEGGVEDSGNPREAVEEIEKATGPGEVGAQHGEEVEDGAKQVQVSESKESIKNPSRKNPTKDVEQTKQADGLREPSGLPPISDVEFDESTEPVGPDSGT